MLLVCVGGKGLVCRTGQRPLSHPVPPLGSGGGREVLYSSAQRFVICFRETKGAGETKDGPRMVGADWCARTKLRFSSGVTEFRNSLQMLDRFVR